MLPAISVRNLGKRYRVNHAVERAPYRTLRDSLVRTVGAPVRLLRGEASGATEHFWALKDVTFEVQPGEVVGVIGSNGAGKSTLLKILSRITTPTIGEVQINGRVGSLLEVGTGFHPELTGRENVYMSGSILGMSRREIARRFDEIVSFAEVERFLDTPVKRYSSGMYVRLAFGVAAHLEPEILVIDEVLAVGDAAFQRRCLRRIGEISKAGRTVLFVSHNLASVRSLCSRAFILDAGRLKSSGSADEQVSHYLSHLREGSYISLDQRVDREGSGAARITDIVLSDANGYAVAQALCGHPLTVTIGYRCKDQSSQLTMCALSIWSTDGVKVFHVDSKSRGGAFAASSGDGECICTFSKLPLAPGMYHINALISIDGAVADHLIAATSLDVAPGDFYGDGRVPSPCGGQIFVDHVWSCDPTRHKPHPSNPIRRDVREVIQIGSH